jgi:hypothetical protein
MRGEGRALTGREDARGEDLLVRSLRRVVAFADGAEEIVLQAEQGVEALEDGPRGAGAVAIVADEAADEEAVALLDPGLVVLAIGPAAGEVDAPALAPAEQAGVNELAAVVPVPRVFCVVKNGTLKD